MNSAVNVQAERAAACAFCKRRLGAEYYFCCRACGASYCYVHMGRHERRACARRALRRDAPMRVAPSSANV